MRTRSRLAVVFCCLLFTPTGCDCQSDETAPDVWTIATDSASVDSDTEPSVRDSHEPKDQERVPPETDVDSDKPETAVDGDQDAGDGDQILDCSVEFAPESGPYVCGSGQQDGRVAYQSTHERIPAPETDEASGPITLAELRETFGGSFPRKGSYSALAEDLNPNSPVTRGFAEPGDDVVFHVVTVHPRDEYGDSQLHLTALLNYRPTEATYRHYNEDRSSVLAQKQGTGLGVPVDGPVEIVDVTIPADAFDEPGRYDLAVGWDVDGSIEYSTNWNKMRIYYGGCAPVSHECLETGEILEMNETEHTIRKEYYTPGYVYPGGEHAGEGPFEVTLDRGRRVTVNFSVLPLGRKTDHSFAVVPMLRGKPLDKRFLLTTPPKDPSIFEVGYRDSFEVEIPDKPGRYKVELGVWDAPFLEPGDHSGLGLGEVRDNTGTKFGTNNLTYIVE